MWGSWSSVLFTFIRIISPLRERDVVERGGVRSGFFDCCFQFPLRAVEDRAALCMKLPPKVQIRPFDTKQFAFVQHVPCSCWTPKEATTGRCGVILSMFEFALLSPVVQQLDHCGDAPGIMGPHLVYFLG